MNGEAVAVSGGDEVTVAETTPTARAMYALMRDIAVNIALDMQTEQLAA